MARKASVPLMREPRHWPRQFENFRRKASSRQRHRARIERARDTNRTGGKWHPTTVSDCCGASKAQSRLARLTSSLGPFFCP